jgi:hypothetical protein
MIHMTARVISFSRALPKIAWRLLCIRDVWKRSCSHVGAMFGEGIEAERLSIERKRSKFGWVKFVLLNVQATGSSGSCCP